MKLALLVVAIHHKQIQALAQSNLFRLPGFVQYLYFTNIELIGCFSDMRNAAADQNLSNLGMCSFQ